MEGKGEGWRKSGGEGGEGRKCSTKGRGCVGGKGRVGGRKEAWEGGRESKSATTSLWETRDGDISRY